MNKEKKVASPIPHVTLALVSALFFSIITMAFIFELEVVARGVGRVVPISRTQIIQPEFNGKVTTIYVRNGVKVIQGQPLIDLDNTDTLATLNIYKLEKERLLAEHARITALVTSLNLLTLQFKSFKDSALDKFVSTSASERALLTSEANNIQVQYEAVEVQKNDNNNAINIVIANIYHSKKIHLLQNEKIIIAKKLYEKKIWPRTNYLEAQETLLNLERNLNVLELELKQKQQLISIFDNQQLNIVTDQNSQWLQRKSVVEEKLNTITGQVVIEQRKYDASRLISPINGVVHNLKMNTVGGIARASEELMHIIPSNEELEIEAFFSNVDIGFVRLNQHVNIKFEAYPSERYGLMDGIVSDISADALEFAEGEWGFMVKIKPSGNELITGGLVNKIRSGMTAIVDIETEKRLIISYFFAPLIKTLESSLGER